MTHVDGTDDGTGYGVKGQSDGAQGVVGIHGNVASSPTLEFEEAFATGGDKVGVAGLSADGLGVFGISDNSNGVMGITNRNATGVTGFADSGMGVAGVSTSGPGERTAQRNPPEVRRPRQK